MSAFNNDFFEKITDNFTAQFMDKMYNWFTNLNIKFDKNLDPKVLEMITYGRRQKSDDKNDEPKYCKICYGGGRNLISPCNCKGSVGNMVAILVTI